MNHDQVFKLAKERYGAVGVDVEKAIASTLSMPISMHCWQGDDVMGFEGADALTGGIAVTGNYPGRARTADELRMDIEKALSFLPGVHKINLHANYLDTKETPDRDELEPRHFHSWVDWANAHDLGLDFNTTFFSHDKSKNGTLTNPDQGIRDFWIAHAKRVRAIGSYFAYKTGKTCVINHWIPDGEKELPVDSLAPRKRLLDSLDAIFKDTPTYPNVKDAVESKLFGIGTEAYNPGSHEFYMGYALTRPDLMVTMDAGHYHPTESVAAKISSMLCYFPEIMLHVSRPVRWDSDHVVLWDEETKQIMREVVACDALQRVYIATDFFDASVNRIMAWATGMRSARKALLTALLEPVELLKQKEREGDRSSVLAMRQEFITLPWGAVWDELCRREGVIADEAWVAEVKQYEKDILQKRG